MSIVVRDNLADRALLPLLTNMRNGQIVDEDTSISAIERVVQPETA